MSTLQKVNLGTPPTAVDGDTARGANTKANANVDVLNAQATLTSAAATITSAQALTAAHVGKRVNINLAAAGTINLPSAATMGLDGIVHLRNLGATLVTLAIAAGSGDTIALTKLAAGESADLDSDGVHTIGCLLRGRTNSDNEVVAGNLTVGSSLTIGGNLSVAGVLFVPPGPLTAYSPSLNASSGGYANAAAYGYYVKLGRLVFVSILVDVPSAGSASIPIIGLPFAASAGYVQVLAGRESGSTGLMLQGVIAAGGSTMSIFTYSNGNPIVSGAKIVVSGVYEAAA